MGASPSVLPEYVEIRLVDPERLTQHGEEGSIVMKIIALYNGDFFKETNEGGARDQNRVLNAKLSDLTHRVGAGNALKKRVNSRGGWILTFCSRCGGRLGARKCERCNRSYQVSSTTILSNSLRIPPKVVSYAKQNRHSFDQEPPRP